MLCPPHEAGRGDGGALLAVRSAQRPAPVAVTAGSGHGSQSGGRWREAPSVDGLPSAAGHPVRPLGTEGRRQKKEPGTRRSGGPGGRTTTLQAAGDAPVAPGACTSARGSGAPVSLTTRRATGNSATPLAPSVRGMSSSTPSVASRTGGAPPPAPTNARSTTSPLSLSPPASVLGYAASP